MHCPAELVHPSYNSRKTLVFKENLRKSRCTNQDFLFHVGIRGCRRFGRGSRGSSRRRRWLLSGKVVGHFGVQLLCSLWLPPLGVGLLSTASTATLLGLARGTGILWLGLGGGGGRSSSLLCWSNLQVRTNELPIGIKTLCLPYALSQRLLGDGHVHAEFNLQPLVKDDGIIRCKFKPSWGARQQQHHCNVRMHSLRPRLC